MGLLATERVSTGKKTTYVRYNKTIISSRRQTAVLSAEHQFPRYYCLTWQAQTATAVCHCHLGRFFSFKACWLSFDSVLREHTISGLDTFRLPSPTTTCCLHHCLLFTPEQLPPSHLTRNTASCCLALFYYLFIFIFCLMIWSQHFMAEHVDSICSNTVRNVIKNYSDFRQFLKSLEYCFYWIIED